MPLADGVAPLAGAWIETWVNTAIDGVGEVAPLAGAWIETIVSMSPFPFLNVAPLAGAWIETCCPQSLQLVPGVAPLAGAWIETRLPIKTDMPTCWSHPLRVRGLKPKAGGNPFAAQGSHPLRVRGLKLQMLLTLVLIFRRTPCGCVD